jgi:hypothetical protein
MALERKDGRCKLDEDMHRALTVFSEADGVTDGAYIERVLVEHLRHRIHATTVAAAKLQLAGITGNSGEKPGTSGRGR